MKERIQNLLQAIRVEKAEETELYNSFQEGKTIQEKISAGICIYPIEYLDNKYDQFENLILHFKFNEEQSGKMFSQNGKLNLFSEKANEADEGIVIKNRNGEITIQLLSKDLPEWIKDGKLGLNALCDTKTYDIQIATLENILKEENNSCKSFYNYQAKDLKLDHLDFPELNESQCLATNRIFTENSFQIIHGPPGTGKTKTLVTAIAELEKRNKKVIVAAPSNAAVDHITHELSKKNIKVLRVGSSFKMDPKIEHISLRNKILDHDQMTLVNRLKKDAEKIRKKANRYVRNFGKEEFQERKELRKELKTILKDIRIIETQIKYACIDEASVITGTFIGLHQSPLKNGNFDCIMVDEAGQTTEPLIWTISHLAPKIIMAGDPMQLPPSVMCKKAIELGLNQSLIEIGIEHGIPTTLLDTQYRMNDKIMQFSNVKFYEEKLKSNTKNSSAKIKGDDMEPIEFIDTAGCDFSEIKNESGGISNLGEIDLIKKRLNELSSDQYSIGIISPYRLQVKEIQDELTEYANNINTIDSFQGQERDIIIISLTRSNENSEIGFLKDYRRMNVAMTRAKLKLIIIGDSACLGSDFFYNDLLAYIETAGSYRSAWEYS